MRARVAAVAACVSISGLSMADDVQAAIRKRTSISAPGLGPTLQWLAKERHVQLVNCAEVVGDRHTNGTSGQLTLDETLGNLPNGRGVTYQYLYEWAITFVPLSTSFIRDGPKDANAPDREISSLEGERSSDSKEKAESLFAPFRGAQIDQVENRSPRAEGKQASGDANSDKKSSSSIEEIVVTAQRREQNLQETPMAVSAMTTDVIAERQLLSIIDVDRYVPNLQWGPTSSGATSTSSLSIRGIGQVDFATTTDPGVAMHLDGVYLGRATGSSIDLIDIERIEILRGPQGTLFGRNSAGGAVNIITNRPTGLFGGVVEVTGGAYTRNGQGKVQGKLSLDFPVTNKLAAKLNLLGKYSDGWGENVALGRGEGMAEDEDIAVRLALLSKPTEKLDLHFTFDHTDRNGTVMPHAALLGPEAMSEDDPSAVRLNATTDDKMNVTGFSLTTDLTWESITFRSITAYREQKGSSGQDFDGSDLAITEQLVAIEQHQFTEELHAFGPAFIGKLDWLLGFFYFTEDAGFDTDFALIGTSSRASVKNGTESKAAFGNATLHATDALRFAGGVRYTDERKDIDNIDSLFGPTFPPIGASAKFTDVSHKVALEYQITDQAMTYVSWAQGFRSGGFNGRPTTPEDLVPYDEETNDSYEIGLKAEWLDSRLRLNLATFLSEYEGIQLTTVVENSDGGLRAVTANAGDAEIKGVEVEFDYAASEKLRIFGALGVQDVRHVIEAREGFVLDPSRVGDSLPQASELNSALGFSYLLPWGRYASFSADWVYRDGYFHQIDNAELTKENGYHLLNARLNLRPNDNWSVTLYGKNLTDEVYRAYGVAFAPLNLATVWYGPTCEIGATVSWSF
jgi:iron complex outermembrane receptor protein